MIVEQDVESNYIWQVCMSLFLVTPKFVVKFDGYDATRFEGAIRRKRTGSSDRGIEEFESSELE